MIIDKRTKPGKVEDSIEKKRLKRKMSKAKLRQKRKAAKQQNSTADKASSAVTKTVKETAKPVFNKDGNIVFSKFDFTDKSHSKASHKSDKPTTGKNYKVLLDQVTKQKEKIEKIGESNPTKAKQMAEKMKWKTAMSKAEGVKVRDNPELLKKSMKKHEKKKEHSEKKWKERETNLAKNMKQRQDKRAKNIAKKKDGKKEKKVKLAKKRGRFVD